MSYKEIVLWIIVILNTVSISVLFLLFAFPKRITFNQDEPDSIEVRRRKYEE
jgi:hypothetical protein